MTILTRHVVRSLVGPFLFALALLTGLMFVEALTRHLDEFSGKGLPAGVIAEAVALILPHTIAVALPAAVLVAVLYAFSDLAASGEVVAMAGNGVRPRAMLLPALGFATVVAGVTYTFNDVILPEANHRLATVRNSIFKKSPTFSLRAKVFNRIDPQAARGPYFLRADSIDPVANRLENIVIHDLSRPPNRGIIYAARGEMALTAQFTDLQLRLHDGEAYEVDRRTPETLQHAEFKDKLYVLRDVGDVLEASDGGRRSDREMSAAQLRQAVAEAKSNVAAKQAEGKEISRATVMEAMGVGPAADSARAAAEAWDREGGGFPVHQIDALTRRAVETVQAHKAAAEYSEGRVSRYGVEIHKKLVLATGCIVFVLIGVPLGIRFPLGGVGMVILVSTAVLFAYRVGLNNGEDFADRGLASPFWAMWTPSVVFTALGACMVARLGRWVDAGRSGSLANLRDAAARALALLVGRTRAAK